MLIKWLLAITVLLLLLARTPLARVLRLGRLPGDVHIGYQKRMLHLPFTSTALIAFALWVLSKVF